MKFTELDLPQFILDAMNQLGFEEATEIQALSLPIIRSGSDMVGQSKTGSGKTFAYGIPAIEKVEKANRNTQVLIVSPTRELAGQICDEMRKITSFVEGYRVVPIFGGSNMFQQIKSLKDGARIVVGTPGRLIDHLERKTLKLKNLKMLILDEADEMLNMGFKEDIETILKSVNEDHQTIMFSATMPPEILKITKNYMKEPKFVTIEEKELDSQIAQKYLYVGQKEKQKALNYLYETHKPRLSIVFSNTKRMVDTIVENLSNQGYFVSGLHGDMRQNERKKVMQQIKAITNASKGINILVASDVAARGIDISDVDMVINYDIPNNSDYYIHRIGRTGRAGKLGIAYSIANSEAQVKTLHDYSKEKKFQIEEETCFLSKSANSDAKESGKDSSRSRNTSRSGFKQTGRSDSRRSYGRRNESDGQARRSYGRSDSDRRNDRGSRFEKREGSDGEVKRSYGRRNESDGDTKRSYGRRNESDGEVKRSYTRRNESDGQARRSYGRRNESEGEVKRTYTRRNESDGQARRSFGRSDRESRFEKRNDSDRGSRFEKREDSDREVKRSYSRSDSDRRSERSDRFAKKDFSRKPRSFDRKSKWDDKKSDYKKSSKPSRDYSDKKNKKDFSRKPRSFDEKPKFSRDDKKKSFKVRSSR